MCEAIFRVSYSRGAFEVFRFEVDKHSKILNKISNAADIQIIKALRTNDRVI